MSPMTAVGGPLYIIPRIGSVSFQLLMLRETPHFDSTERLLKRPVILHRRLPFIAESDSRRPYPGPLSLTLSIHHRYSISPPHTWSPSRVHTRAAHHCRNPHSHTTYECPASSGSKAADYGSYRQVHRRVDAQIVGGDGGDDQFEPKGFYGCTKRSVQEARL